MLRLEERREEITHALQDGELFLKEPQKARQISEELPELTEQIEKLYERWQELEDLD